MVVSKNDERSNGTLRLFCGVTKDGVNLEFTARSQKEADLKKVFGGKLPKEGDTVEVTVKA